MKANKATRQAMVSVVAKAIGRKKNLYAGVDLHRDVLQIEVQAESGVVLFNGAFSTAPGTVRALLGVLSGRTTRISCEATGFWYWFADLCREFSIPLVLANPRQLRVVADSVKKCDRLDAHWICEFLRQGYLAEAAVPEPEARDRREILRTRQTLKRHVQDLKRQIKSFLMQYGVRLKVKDAFCRKGIEELRGLTLRPLPKKSLEFLVASLEGLTEQLKAVEDVAIEVAEREMPARELQEEVPGIGRVLAATILAEAMDVSRFGSDRKFAAHTGIVPTVKQSAGKQAPTHITKQGPRHLRWALVQAARLMVAHDAVVKAWYERHRRRKGPSRAYVMVAHKLARYIYWFSVHGLSYDPSKLFAPAKKKTAA